MIVTLAVQLVVLCAMATGWVMSNADPGGGCGPAWHDQAVRENRHKVAEDFAAIAKDLVATGRGPRGVRVSARHGGVIDRLNRRVEGRVEFLI